MAGGPRVAVTLEQCWHEVPGGTASAALESIRALLTHTDLDLIGVSARHSHPPPVPWVAPIPVCGLPLPRLALYESWHWLRWPPVQRATGVVDVIHATGMAVPPRTAPLVVTVHDLGFLHEPGHSTRRGLTFFRRAIELARRDADIVIVPSQSTFDDCVTHGFDAARMRLVPWGISVRRASKGEVEAARAHFGLDRPYVLWVGTVEPRKNISRLVEAFARLGREDIDLALAGPRGWNEDLDRVIAPVRERVRVLDFVTPDELRALYAGALVFCLPSIREGFGLPVLEAMAQGAMVVTSRGTATEEVLGDAGLLVDPLDVTEITAALRSSLEDGERARELGSSAALRASTFSWERTARVLAAVYEEAAAL